jgi:hypothetical protein
LCSAITTRRSTGYVETIGGVRGIGEHFSDYETGSDRRRYEEIPAQPSVWWCDDGSVGVSGGHTLDASAASAAAAELARCAGDPRRAFAAVRRAFCGSPGSDAW